MNLQQQIKYGGSDIPFSLSRGERKRVRIEVMPDSSVRVIAPASAKEDAVLKAVNSKARWIVRQQRYFRQFEPRTTAREYVSGETHLYLGRRYRLKVHAVDDVPGVKLAGAYIHVYSPDAADHEAKRDLLDAWYRGHAERVFNEILGGLMEHKALRGLQQPRISIRKLKARWGSYTQSDRMLLNVTLIRAPRRCIEYVIAHELCHQAIPNHSPAFYRLLRKVQPDWEKRKALLEATLA